MEESYFMSDSQELIRVTVERHLDGARLSQVLPREGGPQGYSGATLTYFDVTYQQNGTNEQTVLVVKDAPMMERQAMTWLGEQGAPVPFSHTFDLETDARRPICMQYVGSVTPPAERVQQAARTLAAVHAAGLKRRQELSWLPRADADFYAGWLIHNCWRDPWQRVLSNDDPFTDAFGNQWPAAEPGADFAAEFAGYSQPLEEAAARFLDAMTFLWNEGDSLTILHGDFHDDHVRTLNGREYIIDWGDARFGSLYVDLPNYFSRQDALLYRDALAELGHDIPAEQFLARYDAVRPYPGFKYFGIGLWNWRYGNPLHQAKHVYHFMKMILPYVESGA
jgi:hypothetical protein